MWKNTSMAPTVQIFHIKALPLGFLVSSQLILVLNSHDLPNEGPWFPESVQPPFSRNLSFFLWLVFCALWIAWAPEPSVYLLSPYLTPISNSPVFRLLSSSQTTSGEDRDGFENSKAEETEVLSQPPSPSSTSNYVCVCIYGVFVIHPVLITGDRADVKHTQTALTRTALALPWRTPLWLGPLVSLVFCIAFGLK